MTTDIELICTPGYARAARHVAAWTRAEVFARYGVAEPRRYDPDGAVVDHLIPLELGGSNDLANLWPQSEHAIGLDAEAKDRLENRLHAMVCAGQLPVIEAQHAIAADWIAAYRRYVGQ